MSALFGRTSNSERAHADVLSFYGAKGIQTAALISPPLALIAAIRRRPFRLTPIFRSSALATFGGGTAVGAGLGWASTRGKSQPELTAKAIALKSDVASVRTTDHAIIGGVLGGLVATTVFLSRVPKIWTLTGGGAMGVAGGVLYEIASRYKKGQDTGVQKVVDEAKEAVGKD